MRRIPLMCLGLTLLGPLSAGIAAEAPKPQPQAASPAQVPAEPQVTTASYGDWVLRCVRTAGDAKRCEIVQSIQSSNQQPIAQVAIGRPSAKDPVHVAVVLPVNVTLTANPRLGFGDADAQAVEAGWKRCSAGACFADAVLPEAALSRWGEASKQGEIKFVDAAGNQVVLPFSPRGLAQAVTALGK